MRNGILLSPSGERVKLRTFGLAVKGVTLSGLEFERERGGLGSARTSQQELPAVLGLEFQIGDGLQHGDDGLQQRRRVNRLRFVLWYLVGIEEGANFVGHGAVGAKLDHLVLGWSHELRDALEHATDGVGDVADGGVVLGVRVSGATRFVERRAADGRHL